MYLSLNHLTEATYQAERVRRQGYVELCCWVRQALPRISHNCLRIGEAWRVTDFEGVRIVRNESGLTVAYIRSGLDLLDGFVETYFPVVEPS